MATTTASSRQAVLEDGVQRLCAAFAAGAPLEQISPLFIAEPTIIEHGPSTPSVPFLDTFTGPDALKTYMGILADNLTVSDASYSQPIVDVIKNAVSVKEKGRFTWKGGKGDGLSWDEEFVYMLSDFDEEGRIGKWEVWADPLNAWLASEGRKLNK